VASTSREAGRLVGHARRWRRGGGIGLCGFRVGLFHSTSVITGRWWRCSSGATGNITSLPHLVLLFIIKMYMMTDRQSRYIWGCSSRICTGNRMSSRAVLRFTVTLYCSWLSSRRSETILGYRLQGCMMAMIAACSNGFLSNTLSASQWRFGASCLGTRTRRCSPPVSQECQGIGLI
jgi:hypothetical protein